MRVLIIGAGGFLGSQLLQALKDHTVIAASRQRIAGCDWRRLGDLRGTVDWDSLLREADAVVHLANIAHQHAHEDDFERVNVHATEALCAAAKRQQVKHLIYISSIYAQVGHSSARVVTEEDEPAPVNAYGRSKLAAERAVAASGVPYTILRPVLVVGPGAKGNVKTLYRLARLPIPLPLGSIGAKRSVLSIENFVTAVATVLVDARAIGQTFIIADRTPLTVGELLTDIRLRLGRRPNIFAVPGGLFKVLMQLPATRGIWERLGEPLVVSPDKLISIGWSPTR